MQRDSISHILEDESMSSRKRAKRNQTSRKIQNGNWFIPDRNIEIPPCIISP